MSKQDYILIASALRQVRDNKTKRSIVILLTDSFVSVNPKFKPVQFELACYQNPYTYARMSKTTILTAP